MLLSMFWATIESTELVTVFVEVGGDGGVFAFLFSMGVNPKATSLVNATAKAMDRCKAVRGAIMGSCVLIEGAFNVGNSQILRFVGDAQRAGWNFGC